MPRYLSLIWVPALICSTLAAQAGSSKVASVYTEPLPVAAPAQGATVAVRGVLFGQPFAAGQVLVNSYSLVLRQKHKVYTRLVINFAALHTGLPGQDFSSTGKLQPRVEVFQRRKNGEKLLSKSFSPGDDYALHVKFGPRKKVAGADTTSGAIVLRFADGDYVTGAFVARQSPRLIWDAEAIED